MASTRVALVTGAAGGIGRASALALAQDGLDVAISDLPGSNLADVAKEIEKEGRRAHLVFADISDEKQVADMVSSTVEELGRLDVVRLIGWPSSLRSFDGLAKCSWSQMRV